MRNDHDHFLRQLHGNVRRYVKSLKREDWTKPFKVFQHLKHFSGYTLIIRKRSLKDKRYKVILLGPAERLIRIIPITVTPHRGLRWIDLEILQLLEVAIEI